MGLLDVLRPRRARAAGEAISTSAVNVWREMEIERTLQTERTVLRQGFAAQVAYSRHLHRVRPSNGYTQRGWEPTVSGPMWSDFLGDSASADEEVRQRLRLTRERSRRLERTNPYARRYFSLYLSNVVGEHGIRMKPAVKRVDGSPDDLANRRLRNEWEWWCESGNCTLDGGLNWLEVLDLLAISWQRDGEALLRIVRGKRYGRWGMVVEPIEADQLDLDLSTQHGDNEIRMGVEIARETKRVVAYWILNAHPGDSTISLGSKRHTRVLADDLVHLYWQDRIGQHRGVPRLEAGMARLHMLGGYEEAEVVASRAASSKFGVVTTESGSEYEGDDIEGQPGTGGNESVAFSDFGQGTVEQLPGGWKFDLVNPTHPTTQFDAARKGFLRGFSASTGVNYNSIASDLEGVNYSSLRHGSLEERDHWKREQKRIALKVCQDVFEDWLDSSLMEGALTPLLPSNFDRYRKPEWVGKRWTWIDPEKEAKGKAVALPIFGTTITEIAEERGRTVDDIAVEIEAERQIFAKHGIVHPLDRKPDAGKASPGNAAGEPPAKDEGDE